MLRIKLSTIKKEDIEEIDEGINFDLIEQLRDNNSISEIIIDDKFQIVMLKYNGSKEWVIHPEFLKKIDKTTKLVNGIKGRNDKKREKEFIPPSLDELLDKISKDGIDSLSKLERKALESYGK